jgi:hypothetical protein
MIYLSIKILSNELQFEKKFYLATSFKTKIVFFGERLKLAVYILELLPTPINFKISKSYKDILDSTFFKTKLFLVYI